MPDEPATCDEPLSEQRKTFHRLMVIFRQTNSILADAEKRGTALRYRYVRLLQRIEPVDELLDQSVTKDVVPGGCRCRYADGQRHALTRGHIVRQLEPHR